MPVLIDGHNLIPKIAGLSLSDLDDEESLIKRLQQYARLSRKQVSVFFDKAQPGQARAQKHGSLDVRFAPVGVPADEEIRRRLDQLGKAARNWVVVSSDQRVQTYARAAHAQVKSSEAFAAEMQATLDSAGARARPDGQLDEAEVAMWMELFASKSEKKKPKGGEH